MNEWAFYPVIIGTILSVILWLRFIKREYNVSQPGTLSEIAARKEESIRYFRAVLWICGPMFGMTAVFFVAPRSPDQILLAVWLIAVVLEMLVGVFPPISPRMKLAHELIAYAMGAAMFIVVILLAFGSGELAWLQGIMAILMLLFVGASFVDKTRYLHYELGFIFSSHLTMVIAAIDLL